MTSTGDLQAAVSWPERSRGGLKTGVAEHIVGRWTPPWLRTDISVARQCKQKIEWIPWLVDWIGLQVRASAYFHLIKVIEAHSQFQQQVPYHLQKCIYIYIYIYLFIYLCIYAYVHIYTYVYMRNIYV